MRPTVELQAIAAAVMDRMGKRGYELEIELADDPSAPHQFHGRFIHHGGLNVRVHLPHDVLTGDPGQKWQSPAVEHVCQELNRQRFHFIYNLDATTGKPR
jgi:hypothetical protein